MGVGVSLSVSIVFWCLLFPGQGNNESSNNDTKDDFQAQNIEIDVVLHSVNSLLGLFDVFFSGTPVRILHALYIMIAGSVYAVFSVIYWAAGGTNTYNDEEYIYPILDYGDKPVMAALTLIFSIFVGVPLIQLLVYGCYKLREKLVRRYYLGKVAAEGNGQAQELYNMESD